MWRSIRTTPFFLLRHYGPAPWGTTLDTTPRARYSPFWIPRPPSGVTLLPDGCVSLAPMLTRIRFLSLQVPPVFPYPDDGYGRI